MIKAIAFPILLVAALVIQLAGCAPCKGEGCLYPTSTSSVPTPTSTR